MPHGGNSGPYSKGWKSLTRRARPAGTATLLRAATKTGEGGPKGELVPEAVLLALAQVAGASVLAGVLDAGVDGHSAVSALRRRKTARLGGLSVAARTRDPRELPASSGMRLGRWQGALGQTCPVTPRKPKGALASGRSVTRKGGMRRIQESGPRLHCLPESTRPACPKRRVGAWAADAGSPGFTFQLRLFPVGWS